MTVLVVDDNRMNQVIASGQLSKLGHGVEVVATGAAAVAACAERRFDLILMDIMMPEMDGYEATGRIRCAEASEARHTPIVGVSARAMDGDREIAIRAGLDDYLTKPVHVADLERTLERWIPLEAEAHDRDDG